MDVQITFFFTIMSPSSTLVPFLFEKNLGLMCLLNGLKGKLRMLLFAVYFLHPRSS